MCIPFGGSMFNQQAMVSCSQKGQQLKQVMQFILGIHLMLSIFKMFVFSPFSALNDIISCLILYCGVNQNSFCHILMYMIFCLIDAFFLLTQIGFWIQTGTLSKQQVQSDSQFGIYVTFIVILCIFYIFATYFSFKTYKEFKAMYQEEIGDRNPLSSANPMSYGALPNANRDRQQDNVQFQTSSQEQTSYKPFSGQGKRLGDY